MIPNNIVIIVYGDWLFDLFSTQDISRNLWVTPDIEAPCPSGRRSHSAICLNDKLLIFGGYNGSNNGMYILYQKYELKVSIKIDRFFTFITYTNSYKFLF